MILIWMINTLLLSVEFPGRQHHMT
jgi:hypothetical protein